MPATREELSGTYYAVQAATAEAVGRKLSQLWASLDLNDLDGSWLSIREQVVLAVAAGQLRAASAPSYFLEALLALEALTPAPVAAVPAAAFVGYTAAGLPLGAVTDVALVRVKQGIAAGASRQDATQAGFVTLDTIGRSETQDAGRGAMEAAIRLDSHIIGYERHVHMPACDRCIPLAGRVYRYSTGFQRHPRCDCTHLPVTRAQHRTENLEQTPSALFQTMTPAQQDGVFGKAAAQAIRSGADMSRVVNARAGMSVPGDHYTTSSTTRRGVMPGGPRLSPQGVAREAGADDVRYRELLAANGYL